MIKYSLPSGNMHYMQAQACLFV